VDFLLENIDREKEERYEQNYSWRKRMREGRRREKKTRKVHKATNRKIKVTKA
jgi:hypothetical protein